MVTTHRGTQVGGFGDISAIVTTSTRGLRNTLTSEGNKYDSRWARIVFPLLRLIDFSHTRCFC